MSDSIKHCYDMMERGEFDDEPTDNKPDAEQQEAEERKPSAKTHYGKPMSKERLKEIMKVIFPWGYAEKPNLEFVGPSPYLYEWENIIALNINESYCDGAALNLILVKLEEDAGTSEPLLGFYVGLMRALAPEVECFNDRFDESKNVLDFYWKDEKEDQFTDKTE